MKVLLVTSATPAYRHYYQAYTNLPNGILYLASFLEKYGHEVQVYDGYVDDRQPEDFVAFNPDLIGFSVITGPNLEGSVTQSREFRGLFPEAKIVWGNVHPSIMINQTLLEESVDYVVIGAGEHTLVELLDNIKTGEPGVDTIKGLAYRKGGEVVVNARREFINDLESVPDPAWHLVDVKKYSGIGLNTSRGCAHRCTFCYNKSYNKGYIGYFGAERIISQIKHVQEKYGAKYIRFNEDNFTFNRKRLREFCKLMIERKIKIQWGCDSRADLSEADIALMKKAGCVAVGLGLEHGSQRMLDFIQKDITVQEMENTFWNLVKAKIRTSVYIMYGFPTETIEDFKATHAMLSRLDDPYYMFNRFVPFPGSVLFDYCVKHSLVNLPERLEGWPEYLMRFSNQVNISKVPEEMMSEAAARWRATYAVQRFRFTLKHNPAYFWTAITDPGKFFRELWELAKFHIQVNGFYKIVKKKLSTPGKEPVATCAKAQAR
ncbi:B12-binding domain-containing radical SAM protein [Dehalogenimonas etheniformans]|uniref:Radical SAM protein n=1 Tax=Dehalogenimonas etheniformans TaxID=1536648 RepID=A0A2P5P5Y2_9CHLR|nr:radical SAM protein [Dehalogenimonas etheniformans]PPD57690.1 radical SAM protein [Dehalogenimonas etheniformans]QNT76031.1 B12-binding domain-containing radical SAM protein [Dehalogenimonas etheniformans]